MTTNGDRSVAGTRSLGSYHVNGRERQLLAVAVPDETDLRIVDVLVEALPEDGDIDSRHVEDGVSSMVEADAIAADYIGLATRLGWTPMPDVWW